MKGLGASLILSAAGLIGLLLLGESRRRLEAYCSLSSALRLLRGDLASRNAPLADGIDKAKTAAKGMGKELMLQVSMGLSALGERSFCEIWDQALDACSPRSLETPEELKSLGAVLGGFDLETQLQALDGCIARLDELWKNGSRSYPARRRLLLSLTLAGGFFMVILLY